MYYHQRSAWIALIYFSLLEHRVYGIRGVTFGLSDVFDKGDNRRSRKLSHKIDVPSSAPSNSLRPSSSPAPSSLPSAMASASPSEYPSLIPSAIPTMTPTQMPSILPSNIPTNMPSQEPSVQPSLVPTDSYAPSSSPTYLIETVVNEREDGSMEHITDCVAEIPENTSDVTEQVVEFQYKVFLRENANRDTVLNYVESELHNNITAELLVCPYRNLTTLPFKIRSIDSLPKDAVLRSCEVEDGGAAPCFLIDAAFTVEIFYHINARRLQQTADLRVTQAFGPFLDGFFSSGLLQGPQNEIVVINFEGFTNADDSGVPTYGGNPEIDEVEQGTSGVEGEVTSDSYINRGPLVAGVAAVAAAAVIVVFVVAVSYRKRRKETLNVEKLQERGTIRPEESLAQAVDTMDDDSYISKDDNSYSGNSMHRAYIIPDDASTAAGSAILREYSNKYSRSEKSIFYPAFIATGSTSKASTPPTRWIRPYNSNDTVDL
ncbi:hypothetical protein FisN_4Lh538 [Fistulifera solaris]|uniref:SEA domain-containing protein n=1 Tax=Fistulifera solaris TaxID=1519565 RepID=A0A1Z5KDR2_FISSO|nr:hypothetical protein FisN_4Lh538 [Fistulifera solaris]|eukprot:GAX24403.1 hypothetical protein FisN_4Lh538 [Fistulifera solaris]